MRKYIAGLLLLSGIVHAQQSCITFSPILNQTRFILVVDVSGSMDGDPLDDAKHGLQTFVNQMGANDAAALLTFSNSISIAQSMTSDKQALRREIKRMRSSGSTHLYDAVAKAIEISKSYQEKTAIVLLTDGQDSGSQFSARNIKSMVGYHGIAFYAIGLGDVDGKALTTLAKKTSGEFKLSPTSGDLHNLYTQTLEIYRKTHIQQSINTAELMVNSMPGGKEVFFDGKSFGKTPLKLINIQPGEHELVVEFDAGPWTCKSSFNANTRGRVKAIESEVDKNIAILSIPHGSAVFLDDEFQGYTSYFKGKVTKKTTGLFFKKTTKKVDYSKELILENVPKGKHTLSIVPFSGSDGAGMFEKLDYSFEMSGKSVIIKADARTGQVELESTKDKLKPKDNRFELDQSTIFDDF